MSSKLTVAELIERNKSIAQKWLGLPLFSELATAGVPLPAILILTCADPRCNPADYLGLKPGELTITIRNICGHVKPNLNDILALDIAIGVEEILVVHHNDCGATHFKEDQVREALRARDPGNKDLDSAVFGAIGDVPQSVKDDIAILKASPLMRKDLLDKIYGYTFDIKTGLLSKVDA